MAQRILVVDDNPDMRDSLVLVLQHLGHEVREASTGRAALDCVETWRPNIALVDLEMPGMSGYEICEQALRSLSGRATAFVALTGWAGEGPRSRAQAAGFVRHVVKPLSLAELRDLIDELVEIVLPAMTGDAQVAGVRTHPSAHDPAPLDHAHQEQDYGNHKENMDESSQGVGRHESEQPQDDENDSNGGEHEDLPNQQGG